MEISQFLKDQRKEKKMTQEEVAAAIFVSQKSISNWERGKAFPDIDSLIRLARLYDFSLDSILLEGSEVVDDLKKKEKVYQLQKWFLFGPQLTNYLLMVMLFTSVWARESDVIWLVNFILLDVLIATNGVSHIYFQKQLKKADVDLYGDPQYKKINKILFGLFLLSSAVILIYQLFF